MATGKSADSAHVLLGKVAKAQGLGGELKIVPFSGDPDDLKSFQQVVLEHGPDRQTFTVVKWRTHGKFAIAKFREITDRNGAEAQVGAEVMVRDSQMPALAADEFYWHEMIGMRVITDTGRELGKVTSLLETGAKDVMVVTGQEQEYLIPVVDEIIVRQDKEAGLLVIAPMDGLLDINQPDAL